MFHWAVDGAVARGGFVDVLGRPASADEGRCSEGRRGDLEGRLLFHHPEHALGRGGHLHPGRRVHRLAGIAHSGEEFSLWNGNAEVVVGGNCRLF